MKVAVIGSRTLGEIDLSLFLSAEDEIVSGGAVGVDRCAAAYAKGNGLVLTEFLPQYERYGKAAPHVATVQLSIMPIKSLPFGTENQREQNP